MSRFYDDYDDGLPWAMWNRIVSNALGGRRGQKALADMETALLALPEHKLLEGHLALDGGVCAIGALVAHHRAQAENVDIATIIEAMSVGVTCECGHARDMHLEGTACIGKLWQGRSCYCTEYDPRTDDVWDTVDAGRKFGLTSSVAYHLAYLNDEHFHEAAPEERYDLMLAWVRRAQGKAT